MPKVPVYDNFQVAPTAGPNAQFSAPQGPNAGAIGAEQASQMGAAMQQTGGVVAKLVMAEQARADDDRLSDGMNQLVKAKTDLHLEASKLTGRAALDRPDGKSLPDEYTEKLEQVQRDIADKLGNDNQKRAFSHQAGQLVNQFRGVLGTHTIQQQKQFRQDTQSATVEEAQRQAGLFFGDPAARTQAADAARFVVNQVKEDNGWDATKDKALIDATMAKVMSPLHTAVMNGMLNGGAVDAAREYYKANSQEMGTKERLHMHDAINVGDFEKRTQEGAQSVMAQAEGDAGKALALAREKFTGKEQDSVVQRIKAFDAEKTTLDAREAKRVGTQAWSAVMESGRIPPSVLAELRQRAPEEERQIRDWQEAKARRAKADAEGAKTDGFDVYYGLRMMAANDPVAFASLDLRKSEPLLGKSQLNHLTEVQAGISKGDAKAMESGRMLKSTLGIIKAEVAAIGIDLTPKEGTPQAKETAKFMGALALSLDEASKAKGSPLTSDESRRIGMGLLREGIEQGSGIFGMGQTKKRGYQIATDPDIAPGASFVAKRYGDIPQALRDQLASEYRAKNKLGTRPLTSDQEAEIERAYTRGIEKGRF